MSDVLVFGEKGQLASSLKELRPQLRFVGQNQLNLLQATELESFLDRENPRLIINSSAYTAVDRAETEKEAAEKLNHWAPKQMALWSKKNGAKLLHISTDYVFNGKKDSPYLETDATDPINYYGQTKLRGEEALTRIGGESMIFRTSWVYSPFGNNFVKTMLKLGKDRELLSVVSDQHGAPTYSFDLALALLQVADRFLLEPMGNLAGIYHLTNSGETTWYGFAKEIFKIAKEQGQELKIREVKAIRTEDYPTPAMRPKNSRMSNLKAINKLNLVLPPWNHGLKSTVGRLS